MTRRLSHGSAVSVLSASFLQVEATLIVKRNVEPLCLFVWYDSKPDDAVNDLDDDPRQRSAVDNGRGGPDELES